MRARHRGAHPTDLLVVTQALATVLADAGLHPEERILVVMHDSVDLPTVFLGALYAGVVPVLVNTLLPATEYAFMLEHSDARLVVASLIASTQCCGTDLIKQYNAGVPGIVSAKAAQGYPVSAFVSVR